MIDFNDIYTDWGLGNGYSMSFDMIVEAMEGTRETAEGRHRYFNRDVEYQRGHVWSEAQASAFLGSLFSGDPMPPVYLNMSDRSDEMVVIDGKQRLTALYRWLKGEIPAINRRGLVFYVNDLDKSALRRLENRCYITAIRVDWPVKRQIEFYIALNSGGTPHAAEEIERVKALLASA
jgi:hypothetical protein